MTKEIVEKIMQPNTPLEVNAISVDEKKNLAEFLSAKGFTASTFYLRFFQKGFDAWELLGIDNCKSQFLAISDIGKLLADAVEKDALGNEIGKKGDLLALANSKKPGAFYSALRKSNNSLCVKLYDYMEERGMGRTTTIKRFVSENWKPWEVVGIKALLHEFMESQAEKAAS